MVLYTLTLTQSTFSIRTSLRFSQIFRWKRSPGRSRVNENPNDKKGQDSDNSPRSLEKSQTEDNNEGFQPSIAASLPLLAVTTHAAFLPASNSTTATTTTPSPTPTPTSYVVQCGASMGGLCGSICFCSGGGRIDLNCHADPSAQCRNMCRCVPKILSRVEARI
ncbi:hypothetical protein F5X97DRAFT_318360 [Nemania serpens]|nr:hypothetical protein F5X97DRAFT_318360 [Nemania serpens]